MLLSHVSSHGYISLFYINFGQDACYDETTFVLFPVV